MNDRHAVRDISYASAAQTRAGRTVIRILENATGRLRLIRRARGYEHDIGASSNFWEVMAHRYGLQLDIIAGRLETIPEHGPLIIVANHPYGILDGLMLGRILAARRGGDFRMLAHHVFRRAVELEGVILPISFDDTKAAAKLNLETRATALTYLAGGGAIGIFPGGTVSTAARPFDPPMDPSWRTFTAKMIAKSGATIVPVYFEGRNSRLFQLASHLHSTLRVGMLIREFCARLNTPVRVVIGAPIPPSQIAAHKADPKGMMDFLRKATYELSQTPIDATRLGHEFEAKYKVRNGGRNFR